MMYSTDLYLGAFLIIAGFSLSLLNLKRLVMNSGQFSNILISENILLMSIGIVFIIRHVYRMDPFTTTMQDIEERTSVMVGNEEMDCDFLASLLSYGPVIVPLVNSFVTLLIDNYMHYRMLSDVKKEEDDNTVQDFRNISARMNISDMYKFFKKYFSYFAIGVQWIVPVIIALSMYPLEVKEKRFLVNEVRNYGDACMAMVDFTNISSTVSNQTLELRKSIPPIIEAFENTSSYHHEVQNVIDNVNKIVQSYRNETQNSGNSYWNGTEGIAPFWKKYENGTVVDEASGPLWQKFRNSTLNNVANSNLWKTVFSQQINFTDSRSSKTEPLSMKICYIDNNNMILFMFIVCVLSYFVPITISTVILTKIHVMEVQRPGIKTYVSRELLYNILFWTPVMFDTFFTLLLCSYSMNGMRTSIFNVIANIYQAVKNFMNTKYFKENSVSPV